MDGGAHAALGLAAAAVAAAVGAILVPGHPYRWRPAKLAAFAVYFVQQSLRGGIDVASRALHPRMPVDPCWVEHRLTLPPGQPRTLMLSVVTLLPGSLGADFDAARNVLHVHLLARGGDDRLAELERRIAGLFGLESGRAR
jgi:multicomponent Na+:H+ antiporter subunit E